MIIDRQTNTTKNITSVEKVIILDSEVFKPFHSHIQLKAHYPEHSYLAKHPKICAPLTITQICGFFPKALPQTWTHTIV